MALHSKDPVGRPYHVSVYHPYICLPPASPRCLIENVELEKKTRTLSVADRQGLLSHVEVWCRISKNFVLGGPMFVLWQKLFKDIKLRDLSS